MYPPQCPPSISRFVSLCVQRRLPIYSSRVDFPRCNRLEVKVCSPRRVLRTFSTIFLILSVSLGVSQTVSTIHIEVCFPDVSIRSALNQYFLLYDYMWLFLICRIYQLRTSVGAWAPSLPSQGHSGFLCSRYYRVFRRSILISAQVFRLLLLASFLNLSVTPAAGFASKGAFDLVVSIRLLSRYFLDKSSKNR